VLRQMLMEGSLEPAELVTATPEELQTKINECLTRLGNPPKGSVKQLLVQGEVAHGTEAGPEAGKVVATGPQTITVAPVNEPEGAQQAQQAVEAAPAAVAGQAKVLSDDMEVE